MFMLEEIALQKKRQNSTILLIILGIDWDQLEGWECPAAAAAAAAAAAVQQHSIFSGVLTKAAASY